jgi:hypothetical protein
MQSATRQFARALLGLVALPVLACGDGGTEPTTPISPTSLEGSYRITLAGTPRSCDVVSLNIATSTWDAGTCGFAGDRVTVKGDSLLLGYASGAVDYKFFALATRGDEVLSEWRGPCTIALPGSQGCERESGTATWRRP